MSARLYAITGFRLTTAAPDRLAEFYRGLGFSMGARMAISAEEMALLGVDGGGTRLPLRIGDCGLDLDCFDRPGPPYPADLGAADLGFQHFALVTADAAAAWAHAAALGASPISRGGPVTLPPSSGGVTAMKFRDPEGHPLEFLQFPGTSGDHSIVGIDHSAISVAEADAASRFWEEKGLAVRGRTLNDGPTQARLDGIDGPEVDVVPLLPSIRARPHLELLGYRIPRGRPAALQPNDVAGTRTVWSADRDALLRDGDGHLHLLQEAGMR